MNGRKVSMLLAVCLTATVLMASEAAITAIKVDSGIKRVSYNSAIWKKAKFSEIMLYPQTTIKMNDKKANELNAKNSAIKAQVAAIYNGRDIAFMIRWPDDTASVQRGDSLTSYPDGFAVEFAMDYSNPYELPYIGMGSEGRPVVIHLQKAVRPFYEPNGHGDVYMQMNRNQTELFGKRLLRFDKKVKKLGSSDYERSFVGEGFGSMTEIKDGSNKSYARLSYRNKAWTGTLSRPMSDDYVNLHSGAIPVAFAVWDGAKMGRGGLKNLSRWLSVKLEGTAGGERLISALDKKSPGNPYAGKAAVATNGCAGCHQMELSDTPNFMGPALSNIGGYATEAYIRESLVNPSAVIVPGYNRNAHSRYMWYKNEGDRRMSTMTDYSNLDEKTINDIVAYLQSLKAKEEQ